MRDLVEELLQERKLVLNSKNVEALRKEFLTLMKNTSRLRNYKDGEQLKKAMLRFRERFEAYANQVRDDLKDRTYRDANANSGWVAEHLRTMKVIWNFASEVGYMPLTSWGFVKKYEPNKYSGPDDLFRASKKDIDKWAKRVKRKAPPAWKWMKEVGAWAERKDLQGGGGRPVLFNTMDKEKTKIEGFQFTIVGFDEHDRFHNQGIGKLRSALRVYRQRAKTVYPWLLKYQLPFTAYFTDQNNRSAAATYEKDHIAIYTWGIHAGTPKDGAHVIAHEMGHHLYQSVLSGKAKTTWNEFIKGNYTTLDLRTVLAQMKPGESLSDLDSRIEKTQPILSLQISTLMHDISYKSLDLYGMTSIKKYLDKGGDPIFRVPKLPITGYAAKNTEEAFCEALGRLVAFGPRAVLPEVSRMLKTLVGLRVESLEDNIDQLRAFLLTSL